MSGEVKASPGTRGEGSPSITPLNYRLPDAQLRALLSRIPGAWVLADEAFASRLPATARWASTEWFTADDVTAPRTAVPADEARPLPAADQRQLSSTQLDVRCQGESLVCAVPMVGAESVKLAVE